ncbi:MAG: hypothetical protein QOD96_1798, partial [Pseudonocardiales bacterium]|nr:hypothetical protein [Pseudonocardiales bacterium]
NTLGMDVHLALGAEPRDDWRVLRWEAESLRALAASTRAGSRGPGAS